MRTEWILEQRGDSTRVVYRYAGETGAPIPAWVMRLGWRAQTARVIEALAEQVAERAVRQRAGSAEHM